MSSFSREHRVAKEPLAMGAIVPSAHDFYWSWPYHYKQASPGSEKLFQLVLITSFDYVACKINFHTAENCCKNFYTTRGCQKKPFCLKTHLIRYAPKTQDTWSVLPEMVAFQRYPHPRHNLSLKSGSSFVIEIQTHARRLGLERIC